MENLEMLLEFYQNLFKTWSFTSTFGSPGTVCPGTDLFADPLLKNPQLVVLAVEVPRVHQKIVLASTTHAGNLLDYARQGEWIPLHWSDACGC